MDTCHSHVDVSDPAEPGSCSNTNTAVECSTAVKAAQAPAVLVASAGSKCQPTSPPSCDTRDTTNANDASISGARQASSPPPTSAPSPAQLAPACQQHQQQVAPAAADMKGKGSSSTTPPPQPPQQQGPASDVCTSALCNLAIQSPSPLALSKPHLCPLSASPPPPSTTKRASPYPSPTVTLPDSAPPPPRKRVCISLTHTPPSAQAPCASTPTPSVPVYQPSLIEYPPSPPRSPVTPASTHESQDQPPPPPCAHAPLHAHAALPPAQHPSSSARLATMAPGLPAHTVGTTATVLGGGLGSSCATISTSYTCTQLHQGGAPSRSPAAPLAGTPFVLQQPATAFAPVLQQHALYTQPALQQLTGLVAGHPTHQLHPATHPLHSHPPAAFVAPHAAADRPMSPAAAPLPASTASTQLTAPPAASFATPPTTTYLLLPAAAPSPSSFPQLPHASSFPQLPHESSFPQLHHASSMPQLPTASSCPLLSTANSFPFLSTASSFPQLPTTYPLQLHVPSIPLTTASCSSSVVVQHVHITYTTTTTTTRQPTLQQQHLQQLPTPFFSLAPAPITTQSILHQPPQSLHPQPQLLQHPPTTCMLFSTPPAAGGVLHLSSPAPGSYTCQPSTAAWPTPLFTTQPPLAPTPLQSPLLLHHPQGNAHQYTAPAVAACQYLQQQPLLRTDYPPQLRPLNASPPAASALCAASTSIDARPLAAAGSSAQQPRSLHIAQSLASTAPAPTTPSLLPSPLPSILHPTGDVSFAPLQYFAAGLPHAAGGLAQCTALPQVGAASLHLPSCRMLP